MLSNIISKPPFSYVYPLKTVDLFIIVELTINGPKLYMHIIFLLRAIFLNFSI